MPQVIKSDYIVNQPMGSNVPGKVDANKYMNMLPSRLKRLIPIEEDAEEKAKMISALKQLDYPGRRELLASKVRQLALNMLKAEMVNPAINLPYYQDTEVPQGQEEIVDSLMGLYDNDNARKDDYARQGIRPVKDAPYAEGDFRTPSDSPFDMVIVKPRGDGPDPDGLECVDPPTGGDIDSF